MDYPAIRAALADRLDTVEGLAATYATVPDRVVTPSAAVIPGDPFVTFHESMDGTAGPLTLCRFDVVVFAGRFESAAGQTVLDELVGTLPDILEADQTLGETALVVIVREATNYGVVTVADTVYLGCRFDVEVYAK